MIENKRIAVIGGGISGLATAFYLNREIRARGLPWQVVGLEARRTCGGFIQTEHRDGCLIEKGPDSFSIDRPAMLDLCRDLGLESELISSNASVRGLWIREHESLHKLPVDFSGLTTLSPSVLAGIPCLSMKAKLRLLGEFAIPRKKDGTEESLGGFIRRRFGAETLHRLAQPFLGSIFGGDLQKISLRAVFPHWISMEEKYGSLTLAALASRGQSKAFACGFRSFRGGLSVLTEKLQRCPETEWRVGIPVMGLSRKDDSWYLKVGAAGVIRADAVCLTLPAKNAAALLEAEEPALAELLRGQSFRTVNLVNALFRKSDWPATLTGTGIVCGLDKSYVFQGATFSSFKFEGRAPKDKVLVRLFSSADLCDEDKAAGKKLVNEIVDDFRRVAGIQAQPLWSQLERYPEMIASYDLNFPVWKEKVSGLLDQTPGFYLTGQSYHAGGLSECAASAKRTALRMIENLSLKSAMQFAALEREGDYVHA